MAQQQQQQQITILGSLNIDLVSYLPHHPAPGETLQASHSITTPGGKGANQALACSKLSRSSTCSSSALQINMLGAVGDDPHGTTLLASLRTHRINTQGVRIQHGQSTGLAIILVDEPTGQNRIVLSPQANHSLLPADVAETFTPKPDLLIMQLEIRLDTVLQALSTANSQHIPVLLNAAPGKALPPWAYEGLAHLVVNETEAAILSGRHEKDLDCEEGLEAVAEVFLGRGVRNVVITLGGRGVFYATRASRALVAAEKTRVVDTTAAGDTFVGSYALAVARGGNFDIDAAVRAANRAAAVTVSRRGAQVSIPWVDELE